MLRHVLYCESGNSVHFSMRAAKIFLPYPLWAGNLFSQQWDKGNVLKSANFFSSNVLFV